MFIKNHEFHSVSLNHKPQVEEKVTLKEEKLHRPETSERTDTEYLRMKTENAHIEQEIKDHRVEILQNHEKFFTGIVFISFNKMSHADQVTKDKSKLT